jgi:hypothetical protein
MTDTRTTAPTPILTHSGDPPCLALCVHRRDSIVYAQMQEAFEIGHLASVFDVLSVTPLGFTENPSASLGRVYLHCQD